jgi:hypothetical protein
MEQRCINAFCLPALREDGCYQIWRTEWKGAFVFSRQNADKLAHRICVNRQLRGLANWLSYPRCDVPMTGLERIASELRTSATGHSQPAANFQAHIIILPPAPEIRTHFGVYGQGFRTCHASSYVLDSELAVAGQYGKFRASEARLVFGFGCWALTKCLSERRCQPNAPTHHHHPCYARSLWLAAVLPRPISDLSGRLITNSPPSW